MVEGTGLPKGWEPPEKVHVPSDFFPKGYKPPAEEAKKTHSNEVVIWKNIKTKGFWRK